MSKIYGISPGPLNGGPELPRRLDAIQALGCTSIRTAEMQKRFVNGDGTYNSKTLIEILTEADKRGMTVVSGLSGIDGHSFDDPAGYARAYAEVCRVCADHPNVRCVQTINEIDHVKADTRPTPARFVEVQRRAYDAAKQVAPDVLVCTGGLGGMKADWLPNKTSADFLAAAYDEGLKGYFDLVAFHIYSAPYTIQESIKEGRKGGFLAKESRRIMAANGDGEKKILISEHAVPTGGTGNAYTEEKAVEWMKSAHRYFNNHDWIDSAYWFTDRDVVPTPGAPNNNGDHMGLVRVDGSRKLTADAYQELVA